MNLFSFKWNASWEREEAGETVILASPRAKAILIEKA